MSFAKKKRGKRDRFDYPFLLPGRGSPLAALWRSDDAGGSRDSSGIDRIASRLDSLADEIRKTGKITLRVLHLMEDFIDREESSGGDFTNSAVPVELLEVFESFHRLVTRSGSNEANGDDETRRSVEETWSIETSEGGESNGGSRSTESEESNGGDESSGGSRSNSNGKSTGGGDESKAFLQGLEIIHAKFLDYLRERGVELIPAVGRIFDPGLHRASRVVEVEKGEDGLIIGEIAPGYMCGGKAVKCSEVVVQRVTGSSGVSPDAGGERGESPE
jgi:hypothetical protein